MVLLATPGHTPGSMSTLVRRPDRFVDRMYTVSGRFVRRWDRHDALLAS
jgi:hypothetical protein